MNCNTYTYVYNLPPNDGKLFEQIENYQTDQFEDCHIAIAMIFDSIQDWAFISLSIIIKFIKNQQKFRFNNIKDYIEIVNGIHQIKNKAWIEQETRYFLIAKNKIFLISLDGIKGDLNIKNEIIVNN